MRDHRIPIRVRSPGPRIVQMDELLLKTLVDSDRDPLRAEMASGEEFKRRALVPGLAYAMIDGGYVVAGGGLIAMHAGRVECWALISVHARPRHIVMGVRAMRRFLDLRQRDPFFRRVECFVLAHQCWSASFAEACGFVREGLLRAWDPAGRDHFIFARVRAP